MSKVKQTSVQSLINQIDNLLYGHEDFVRRSTGLTVDPHTDHFLQNTDFVLSNNRHFIADTMAEYQPNGDATTEGQALHVLGYCHAYMATKNPIFLDKAIKAWEAYINFFYNGQPIPSFPQRYICNWIINGKEPCLADYPVNPEEPTQGGYKCVPLVFKDGVARIPHGAPYWGEYLDSCTFAHRGHMTWDAINASVQNILEDTEGKIDWQLVYDKYQMNPFENGKSWTFEETNEGWVGHMDGDEPAVVNAGDLKAPYQGVEESDAATPKDNYFDGSNFNMVRIKIQRIGNPTWKGELWWTSDLQESWGADGFQALKEPVFDENGVGEITVYVDWPSTAKRIRIGLAKKTTEELYADNYYSLKEVFISKSRIVKPYSSLAWIDWEAYLGTTYTVLWGDSNRGVTHPISWLVAFTNNKIGMGKGPNDQLWDGDIIETGLPTSDIGMIKMEESLNGVYLVNYAVKLPVELGGYKFRRNEPWHNRPVHTPFLGTTNQLGNAADAEVWFIDACYLLYRLTGEERFKKALDCVFFTANEYTLIDSTDKFFRQSTTAESPFTDAISYDFSYPANTQVVYTRDDEGYIVMKTNQACQHFLEQQAVVFRINDQSKLRLTYGGQTETGGQIGMSGMIVVGKTKGDADSKMYYKITLPKTNDLTPKQFDIPMNQMAKLTNDATGEDYLVADYRAVTDYGGCTWIESYEENIYDGRQATCIKASLPDADAGLIIGFWLTAATTARIESLVYRSDAPLIMRLTDDNGWNWYWVLEDTQGAWVNRTLDPFNLNLSSYQPNHKDDEVKPTTAAYTTIKQVNITLEDSSATNKTFSYYCVNDVPPLFKGDDGWTVLFRAVLSASEPFTAKMGDCTMIDYRDDSLAYTPGVIPFSNIYGEGTSQIGAWHGMPYPGYQYPFMYTIHDSDKYALELKNQIKFLYDSQEAYYKLVGIMGPGCAAYVWDRWDNYKYGKADTWETHHWGDGKPWSGYQPRAYNAAARAWYELHIRGKEVPYELKTYVERWAKYLIDFAKEFNGHTPNDFPVAPDKPVWIENDFTGHMCGLWLAGTSYALLAGCEIEGLEWFAQCCVAELSAGFTIVEDPKKNINGAWSPDPRVSGDNGMSFGFYTGEIFRGLSLYEIYLKHGRSYDFYQDFAIPNSSDASLNF